MRNVCRICLRVSDKLCILHSDPELIVKIEAISSIQLIDSDFYPKEICEECQANVKKCYNFREVILTNTKELDERNAAYENNQRNKKTRPKTIVNKLIEMDPLQTDESSLNSDEYETIHIKSEIVEPPPTNNNTNDEPTELTTLKKPSIKKKAPERPKMLRRKRYCEKCDITFPSYRKYSSHQLNHRPKGVCNICGALIRKENLSKHIRMHTSGPVSCKICGHVAKNFESLRGHMLYHRKGDYRCQICGFKSDHIVTHRRHAKTHKDPELRRKTCNICGVRVHTLDRHMLTHTGGRPHVCTYCSKGFTSTNALKVHTRRHTNERPYQCEYCPMAFPQKVSLKTHLKSKHGQDI